MFERREKKIGLNFTTELFKYILARSEIKYLFIVSLLIGEFITGAKNCEGFKTERTVVK